MKNLANILVISAIELWKKFLTHIQQIMNKWLYIITSCSSYIYVGGLILLPLPLCFWFGFCILPSLSIINSVRRYKESGGQRLSLVSGGDIYSMTWQEIIVLSWSLCSVATTTLTFIAWITLPLMARLGKTPSILPDLGQKSRGIPDRIMHFLQHYPAACLPLGQLRSVRVCFRTRPANPGG